MIVHGVRMMSNPRVGCCRYCGLDLVGFATCSCGSVLIAEREVEHPAEFLAGPRTLPRWPFIVDGRRAYLRRDHIGHFVVDPLEVDWPSAARRGSSEALRLLQLEAVQFLNLDTLAGVGAQFQSYLYRVKGRKQRQGAAKGSVFPLVLAERDDRSLRSIGAAVDPYLSEVLHRLRRAGSLRRELGGQWWVVL